MHAQMLILPKIICDRFDGIRSSSESENFLNLANPYVIVRPRIFHFSWNSSAFTMLNFGINENEEP